MNNYKSVRITQEDHDKLAAQREKSGVPFTKMLSQAIALYLSVEAGSAAVVDFHYTGQAPTVTRD